MPAWFVRRSVWFSQERRKSVAGSLPIARGSRGLLLAVAGMVCSVPFAGTLLAQNNDLPDIKTTAAQVDKLLAEEIFQGKQSPAERTDDVNYLRRVSFDLIGDLPTPEQVTAFSLDPSENKRSALVERLLQDPQYGQNWARYWRDVILARRIEDRAMLVSTPLVVYLTEQFNKNTSWDEISRAFVTATGDVREKGQTAIIVAQDGLTEETTAEMSRIFLGIQIQCAQCHDHVTDRWKRTEFHELAAFFPRISVRPLNSLTKRTLVVDADDRNRGPAKKPNGRRGVPEHFMADLEHPTENGTRMQPVFFLTGKKLEFGTSDEDRRKTVASWMVDNPWFSKAIVNRIWAELVGEGFYEPIDDLGPDKSCSAPQTMNYLAKQFTASGYDLKWLFTTITATDAYGRQSDRRRNATELPFLASCPQRLRSDQLFSALTTALEIPEQSQNNNGRGGGYRGPRGPRSSFAEQFGYDPSLPREELSGTIPQALALMNSPLLNSQVNASNKNTMLARLVKNIEGNGALVEELYLRVLARTPSDRERETCLAHFKEVEDRKEAAEDVLWALINSAEFLHRK